MKKGVFLLLMMGIFTLACVATSYAGEWKPDAKGWWYQEDDSTFPKETWKWIDGNRDAVAECYYFDGNGYLLSNTTTPDGCQVDANGAWIVNNVVQTKNIGAASGGTGTTTGGGSGSGSVGGESSTGNSQGTQGTTNENGYVVKRYSALWNKKVEGGTIYGYYDFTGWITFDLKETSKYKESKNYVIDGELFCPDGIEYPDCALVEVLLNGDKLIKVTPVWIDNGEKDYGGFGGYGKKSSYIVGRREWREFEVSDPEYAAQLKEELIEEAKQRAFEMYPDMIIDFTK